MGKTYIKGSAKEHVFADGSAIINLTLSIDQLKELPAFETKAGDHRVRVSVAPRRAGADEYGNTHSVYYDDFFDKNPKKETTPSTSNEEEKDDGLPF